MKRFLWFYRIILAVLVYLTASDLIQGTVSGVTYAWPVLFVYYSWRMGQVEKMIEDKLSIEKKDV